MSLTYPSSDSYKRKLNTYGLLPCEILDFPEASHSKQTEHLSEPVTNTENPEQFISISVRFTSNEVFFLYFTLQNVNLFLFVTTKYLSLLQLHLLLTFYWNVFSKQIFVILWVFLRTFFQSFSYQISQNVVNKMSA